MNITLTILGVPVAWARAGSSGRRRYTPSRQAEHAETIRRSWLAAGRPTFGADPVVLSIQYHVAGRTADIDNYLKLTLDALTGCLYDDDRQVVCLSGVHVIARAENPRTVITAWQAKEPSDGSS